MAMEPGEKLAHYEIVEPIGKGGPASARGTTNIRELRRGLAVAEPRNGA